MKVLIACDSYKGCMSSKTVNETIERAILDVNPKNETFKYIIGDGGEGTSEAFVEAENGTYVDCTVHDAYFREIETKYGLIDNGNTAVIEVASCIGLNLYERTSRKPLYATSYGVGELLLDASKRGVKKIILGLGGSSTNDGGMGLLQALGVKFYDHNNRYLKSNASNLKHIHRIDISRMVDLKHLKLIAACDVKNVLLGNKGATHVFGKQKGLFPNQIKNVEAGMVHYVEKFKQLGYDLNQKEGSGAAGGIGAVVLTLLNASRVGGLELLLQYSNMETTVKQCDLVITGEGQSDLQTMYGKVPVQILQLANENDVPCICISGALGLEYNKLYELGFIGIYSIADRAMSFAQALEQAPEKLYACTYSLFKTITYYTEEKE